MYFKYLSRKNQRSQEEFMDIIQRKINKSQNLLRIYESTTDFRSKHDFAEKILEGMNNYSSDYVSINKHSGIDIIPEFNNLVMVSELRAFEIQQVDYKDRFSVFNSIEDSLDVSIFPSNVNTFLDTFEKLPNFVSKMKYLCDLITTGISDFDLELIFSQIPIMYKNYYDTLGKDRIRALSYQRSRIENEFQKVKISEVCNEEFLNSIKSLYKPSDKVSFSTVKERLQVLYERFGLKQTAKARDIEKYYNVQLIKFPKDPISGKRENGYEILSLK